jgi:hypothetical protein
MGGGGRLGDPVSPGPQAPVIRQRDSALPDQEPGTGPIAAIETDNVAAFARDLRVMRSKSGMDYPEMAEKSHYTMRTLASAAGGLRLPTLPVLIAYVTACGADQTEWEERWGKLMKASGDQAALPAAGKDARTAGQSSPRAKQPEAPQPQPHAPAVTKADEVYVITSAPSRDDQSW